MTPKKRRRRRTEYNVYVIELNQEAVPAKRRHERPLPRCVYVGQTAHPLEHRFDQHVNGHWTASRAARQWGVRLLPDLYPAENPVYSRWEAEALEKHVAQELEKIGYVVYWG